MDDTLLLGKNYEAAFDTFEVYFALCAADARLLAGQDAWGPIGRFGWKRGQDNSPLERVMKEAEAQKAEWQPLKAGLFGGDMNRFTTVADEFTRLVGKLHWH